MIRRMIERWRWYRFKRRWGKAFATAHKHVTDTIDPDATMTAEIFLDTYIKNDAPPEWMWSSEKGWIHTPRT